jgi:regulator of sirC expression with transglutaminase-like and TPR domain
LIARPKIHLMSGMAERIISEAHETALIGLLDDPSPVVQKAIEVEFARLGSDGVAILQKAAREMPAESRTHAEKLLAAMVPPDPGQLLSNFIKEFQYDLETGFFLINKVISPDLEIGQVRRNLDFLADRCRELGVLPAPAREQCNLINRVIFHEFGFRGALEDYENPLNSCIDAVLQRRRGLPLTLSVIYILVAQRLGLDLEPIGLPGHFMVGCFHGDRPFYVDPFERGRFRELSDIRNMLERQKVAPELHHVVPIPVSEVLCRACRNLVQHFDNRKEPKWADKFRVFVREFETTHRRQSQA